MARPSKLTVSQCAKAVLLRTEKNIPVPKLAKQFHVSESSMYKVLDGSYVARAEAKASAPAVVAPLRPKGATPSIFRRRITDKIPSALVDLDLSSLEVDDLTLAAAQLIVSRSRFAQALRTM